MSKIIAITNQKGGVGKTTTTANLGYAFSKMGRDVLLIDFDSQASLTNYLNVGTNADKDYRGIYEMMIKELRPNDIPEDEELRTMGFAQLCKACITRPVFLTPKPTSEGLKDVPEEFGFDLLPAHFNLADYELEISNLPEDMRRGNGFRLYNLVQKILAWHAYDYVLIDCNPSLGVMAMNAITAAVDGVLIPTNLDLMSTRGVGNLINKIADVQEALARITQGRVLHMGVIGVILNLFRASRVVDQKIATDLNRFYPFKIFESSIPESTTAKSAVFAGRLYSQVYKKAGTAYLDLAKEIEEKIAEMETEGPMVQRINVG